MRRWRLRSITTRVPIRTRVTAAFALVLIIVLGGIGAYVDLSFRSHLDESIGQGLRGRAGDVAALVTQADTGLNAPHGGILTARGESFAQILEPGGRIFDATPLVRSDPLLGPDQVRRALRRTLFVDISSRGRLNGPARLLAVPVRAQDRRLVIVVGVSLAQRAESLRQLRVLLLIGGAAALVLVSLAGYLAVRGALHPIEAMRRRAAAISGGGLDRRLPVPSGDDEVARLGSTLNAMLARLEDTFTRERQFVSDASHELRTPLGVLKTELELALRGGYSRAELEAAIRSAAEETDRLIQLAEDLLVIARIDQGRLPVRPTALSLAEVAEDVRRRFAARAAQQERPLTAVGSATEIVQADRLRLEQALGNLVDNALRHGTGPITVAARRTGDEVRFEVTDHGRGLPDGFAAIAFDRFTRGDPARGGGGAGLGLAIVQAVAAAHGGRAMVTRRADETTFSIVLTQSGVRPAPVTV